ncbi:tyrosine-type recombinase/integrase [Rhodoferax sp. TBRC 17660]|uniref:Tyrosine-type recombinase/integrase n=1 Tax=Rhodoferax potami TaxID=3068338 RepID=A0ABU3KRL6_9BURK|nr:tyrosine-type recombinase/integrase [Rhodoferax sp. TBRC 17660]MDT7519872.1 tyrosine-type recombinase/integrase [Rhodoferax sp. TBRC 17660]
MASFRQHGNGWQGRIRRRGYPDITKTFETKADAERWARSLESEIDKGQFVNVNEAQRTTLGDLIARYLTEVTPSMKGAAEDTIRLKAIMRKSIARWSMTNLSAARIATYRDERLKEVSAGTVIRELAYLSAIINHARREWGINVPNPVQMVRKPQSPQARSRVLTDEEVSKLLQALEPTGRRSHWIKPAVQLALATAMRRGELLSLRWEHIDLQGRTAFLPDTKNGDARTVPLSTVAVKVLAGIPRHISGVVLPVKFFTLDAAFKRGVRRAGLDRVRFHDLRRTAITRMAEKLPNVIELAMVSGHKSLMVLKRYYRPTASELAQKLG